MGYIQTPNADPAFLYQDTLVALDAERSINIGHPSWHARWLDALALRQGETVIQVGSGTGYYTSLLAHLVGPSGQVHAYEIDQGLAARAGRNLADLPRVIVHHRSGTTDDPPRADAIYVNAGLTQPSAPWLDALRAVEDCCFRSMPRAHRVACCGSGNPSRARFGRHVSCPEPIS